MSTLGLDIGGRDLAELSPDALLDLAEQSVVRRRAAEVDDLLVVAAWADVHSSDPRRDPQGPPGQTGMHNSGPLGRRHHRWKTHAGYVSRQSGTTRWVWRTPYGRHYLVDHRGTRRLDQEGGAMVMAAPRGVEIYLTDGG